MNELPVQHVVEIAKGISDYGFMAIAAAFFLLLSAALMVCCFRWFKNLVDKIMQGFSEQQGKLLEAVNKNGEAMNDIAEGLLPETQMRIKNISGAYFDLAVERVCRMINKVRTENHIANRKITSNKIRSLLMNQYDDRCSRFDNFTYRGRRLSEYCNPKWVDWVAEVVEAELYNDAGENNGRAYTNVSAVYDRVKIDLYKHLKM